VDNIKSAGGTIQGSTFVTDVDMDATQQAKLHCQILTPRKFCGQDPAGSNISIACCEAV